VLILGIGGQEGIFEVGKVEVDLIGVMIMDWSSVEREPVKWTVVIWSWSHRILMSASLG